MELENFRTLLRDMAEAGLTVACYNWMPGEDWQRTSATGWGRGGSLVTEFTSPTSVPTSPTPMARPRRGHQPPGQEMLGRLFAAGYLRGLMQAV